jgi:hypothetical protein
VSDMGSGTWTRDSSVPEAAVVFKTQLLTNSKNNSKRIRLSAVLPGRHAVPPSCHSPYTCNSYVLKHKMRVKWHL